MGCVGGLSWAVAAGLLLLLLLLPSFISSNRIKSKSTEEKERYEEKMNIPLESRNYVVFDKIELDIFRGRKIIQV